jgi:hypothetical protein
LRLTFCGEKPDRLVEGARRLCRAFQEVGAGRQVGVRAIARPASLV